MEQRDGNWKKTKRNCEKVVKNCEKIQGPGIRETNGGNRGQEDWNCESKGRGLHEGMVRITEIKGGNWELGNRMGIRTNE